MPGSPDWQQITEWFGPIQVQATGAAIGAGTISEGPYDLSTYASVIVAVKPSGGTITGTITQTIPGGPAALTDVTTFVVQNGAVHYEAVVLLAGQVTVTLTGSAGGETVTYAIIPANTNVNTNVTSGGNVLNITPTPLASWPPSSPVDGDVQVLELPSAYDPVGSKPVRWFAQYDAASAMWQVSGPPLVAQVATLENSASTTYAALATAGPSVALPRPGDYDIEIGATIDYSNSQSRMSYDIGGTGAVDGDAVLGSGFSADANLPKALARAQRKAGLTAVTLTAKYKNNASNGNFSARWMRVTPVRIT